MNHYAIAWANAQHGLDETAHEVLRVMAEYDCRYSAVQIAILVNVTEEAVGEHVAALVNGGYLLVRDGRLELNVDEEMLLRHLRRNRRQIGSGASPAPVEPKREPEPAPKRGKPPVAPPAPPPTRVFVRQGSPEWMAWLRVRGPRGIPVSYSQTDRAHGWWFASLWPAGQEERGGSI